MDQENMTADIGSLVGAKKAVPIEKASKKSRSKSIGPGGLDALKDTSGNRRKVWLEGRFRRVIANVSQVASYNPSPSPKIYPETYNATSSRDSGAYFDQKNQPEEVNPTHASVGLIDRFQCGWPYNHWS
jgi:hypothetical protein